MDENGFFTDTEAHKLIVCGVLFDRGREAAQLQEFILDLMEKILLSSFEAIMKTGCIAS